MTLTGISFGDAKRTLRVRMIACALRLRQLPRSGNRSDFGVSAQSNAERSRTFGEDFGVSSVERSVEPRSPPMTHWTH